MISDPKPASLRCTYAQQRYCYRADQPLININTANQAELESLPEIGPHLAGEIIAYREANGPFETVDELLDVPGIGPVTLETIRDLITVGINSQLQYAKSAFAD